MLDWPPFHSHLISFRASIQYFTFWLPSQIRNASLINSKVWYASPIGLLKDAHLMLSSVPRSETLITWAPRSIDHFWTYWPSTNSNPGESRRTWHTFPALTRLHYAICLLSLALYGFCSMCDYCVPALVQSLTNKLPGEGAMDTSTLDPDFIASRVHGP